jgi:hypothetical protein
MCEEPYGRNIYTTHPGALATMLKASDALMDPMWSLRCIICGCNVVCTHTVWTVLCVQCAVRCRVRCSCTYENHGYTTRYSMRHK